MASLNAQGKRVMGIRVDDQSQCRQSQDDMMATAPTAVSPPSLSRQQLELERQLIPVLHESDQTVGGATGLQDTLSGSRYQQCPGCSKHVPKRTLMHHIATECTVCMTQKSCESSDEDSVDQRTAAQTLGAPGADDLRDDTHVYCNQQGAAAAPAETIVSGTSGDSDSPDDTGSTESATGINDTGTRTPREVDGVDIPDTGHADLSGHMRQPEFPVAHDHSLDTQVLHWRETCAQATPWSRPSTTGTVDIGTYTSKWTAVITRALHARATAQGWVMQQSQMRSYGPRWSKTQ